MTELPISVAVVVTPEGTKHYVSVMPPDAAFSRGLISEGIVGVLKNPLTPGQSITPDNFLPNRAFATFLAEVIAKHGPSQPGLRDEAKRIGKGQVVLVDQRTPTPEGPVPPEDILGLFQVEDGQAGPYVASPNHQLLTSNGFVRLDGALTACLQQELALRSAR